MYFGDLMCFHSKAVLEIVRGPLTCDIDFYARKTSAPPQPSHFSQS